MTSGSELAIPDRFRILDGAWLSPGAIFPGGIRCRPFSFGSILLAAELDIPLQPQGHSVTARIEAASRFVWSHSQPLEQVLWAVDSGTWEDALLTWELRHDAAAWYLEVEAYLARLEPQVRAAQIECRAKPRRADGPEETEPDDVIEPHWISGYLHTISQSVRLEPAAILWQAPIVQALQWFHAAKRADLAWTVSPGAVEQHKAADAAELDELEAAVTSELGSQEPDMLALLSEFDGL